MYETTSTPNCTDVLKFQQKVEKTEFHPHAVVISTKESCCCCPGGSSPEDAGCCGESSNVSVIPRYKITDFQTGSGRSGLTCRVIGTLVVGVFLIILGSYLVDQGGSSSDSYVTRYTDDVYGASSTTDSNPPNALGIILLLLGIAVVAAMIVFIVLSCCKKEHYYILQYSNGRSGYSFFSTTSEKMIETNDKPNEEFLYNYVYDTIEKANDTSFLHRFSHLNQAGLMEANKDKATPNELKTLTVADGDVEPSALVLKDNKDD